MTQRDLAQKMKREHSFVWRIEKGERRLDVLEFFWVCEGLGQDAETIYTELCKSFRKFQKTALHTRTDQAQNRRRK